MDNLSLETVVEMITNREFEEAKKILDVIILEEPDNIEIIKYLGLCNVNIGNFIEAKNNFLKAVELDAEDASSWFYLASLHDDLGEKEEAISAFLKVIELREDYIDAYKNLSVIYLQRKEFNKIIEFKDKLVELDDEDSQSAYILGLAFSGLNNFDEAIYFLKIALETDKNNILLYNNLGLIYFAKNRIDEALWYFNNSLMLNPNDHVANYNVGIIYQIKSDFITAFPYLKRAYDSNPMSVYLVAAAFSAFNAKMWEEAVMLYNLLILQNPEKENFQYNLAVAYRATGNYQKSISLFENLLMRSPSNLVFLEHLASLYIEIQEFEKSKAIYSSMIEKGNASHEVYYKYAMVCARTNDIDKAEFILKKVIQLSPEHAIAHKDLAVIYLSKRLFDYAKDEFEIAYKLEPKNPYILFELANYYYVTGDHKIAQKYYNELMKHDNIPLSMYLNISMNLLASKKYKKAIEILEIIKKQEPKNIFVLSNLAQAYFKLKNYEVALQLLEDAYFIQPNMEIANMLATAYMKTKHFDEAIKLFKVVDHQSPLNIAVMVNIAICEYNLKNYVEARKLAEKILTFLPESEEAQTILDKLNKKEKTVNG